MKNKATLDDIVQQLRNPFTKERGFQLLMKQCGRSLYWHIRRIVIGHEDAEDVIQEVSIKIYSKFDQFHGNGAQLRTWLYQIATNESLQFLRRQTHFFQSIDSLAPSLLETLTTENEVSDAKPEMLLQKALLALPTTQRLVFNMRYFDEMTYEEIAQVTGKSVGSLKSNYYYASEHVKKYLIEHS